MAFQPSAFFYAGVAIWRSKSFNSRISGGLLTTASTVEVMAASPPAGQHNDRRAGGFSLDRPGHIATVNVRHAPIGYDHFVRLVFQPGGAEHFQPFFSAGGHHHPMTEVREAIIQDFPDLRVVINAKDVQGAFRFGLSHVPARLIDGW
jgi:hypothetical protein